MRDPVPGTLGPAARRRARRVVIQVFAVEIVTLVALWVLGSVFGPG